MRYVKDNLPKLQFLGKNLALSSKLHSLTSTVIAQSLH